MATQAKEIIAEIGKEFKEIVEDFNHLEYQFDKLFDNVERVKGDYTATEAEMVVKHTADTAKSQEPGNTSKSVQKRLKVQTTKEMVNEMWDADHAMQ